MSNINFTYPDEPQQNIVEVRFNSTKEGDKGDKGDKGDRGPRGYGITKVAPINISTASGGRSDYGVYGKDDEGNEIIYTQFSVYNGKDVTAQELPIIGTEPITVNRDADNNYVIGFNHNAIDVGWGVAGDGVTTSVSTESSTKMYLVHANISDEPIQLVNDNGNILGQFTLNQTNVSDALNITNHIIGTGTLELSHAEPGNPPTWVEVEPAKNSLLVGSVLSATTDNCLVIGTKNIVYAEGKTHKGAGYRDCKFVLGGGYNYHEDGFEKVKLKNTFVVDASGSIYCDMAFGYPDRQEDEIYEDVAFTNLVFDMMHKINEIVSAINGLRPGQTPISPIDIYGYMGLRVGYNSDKTTELHHIVQRSNHTCTICHKEFN